MAGIWGVLIAVRNSAYDRGLLRVQRAKVPVVSVGNLTTGGTGKTPIVAAVCRIMQESGAAPGIVSRGYGAARGTVNDEWMVLARLCPGVPHVQNASRAAAASELIRKHPEVRVILMDDGFQHRRLGRELDLALIDATNPFGWGFLLPRGLLREPPRSLARAGAIILTRAELVKTEVLQQLEADVRRWTSVPVLHAVFVSRFLIDAAGSRCPISELAGTRVFLMSGIGNPEAFAETCRRAGLQVVGSHWFPDHHAFTERDLIEVRGEAAQAGAEKIVVTLKDLVKLPTDTRNLLAVEITAEFPVAEHREILNSLLQRTASPEVVRTFANSGFADCSEDSGCQ